ncbi:general stress protein [Pseudonocardia sp. H11422]|uniref:general stress protein n=1 Tax=Pseudonocardia sp. H11422 TaxID=2835866 RepID=UPI001BDD4571|nr:general stress protein [Pseudonocardia sp. H11422]
MSEQPSSTAGQAENTANSAAAPAAREPVQYGPRRAIASFSTYADAERAVDRLADLDFPVDRVAIVGRDLELVEQVTGKMTLPRALWRGALTGAIPGALIGWIFGLFSWVNPLIAGLLLALYGLIFGAVIGALIGGIIYLAQRGRRDFASITMMVPQRYEVMVDEKVADEAARLLGVGV